MFAGKSGMNTGIITSLFTTSLIFTSVYFFFKHGQKLTIFDIIGIIMVIGCVIIISMSGSGSTTEVDSKYQTGAIIFSILTGLMFTINNIEMHYTMKNTTLTPSKMNIDGGLVQGVFLLPFWIYYVYQDLIQYTVMDYVWSNIITICLIFASTCLAKALSHGKAGPVQAIDSLKTVWQVIMTMLI